MPAGMVVPFTVVKGPPRYTRPASLLTAMDWTMPPDLSTPAGPTVSAWNVLSAPLEPQSLATWRRVRPFTVVNWPPAKSHPWAVAIDRTLSLTTGLNTPSTEPVEATTDARRGRLTPRTVRKEPARNRRVRSV